MKTTLNNIWQKCDVVFPLEFRAVVNHEETIESWGYPPVKTP